MQYFSPAPLLRQIGNFVQTNEKLLLAVLAVLIVISGSLWYRQYFNIDGPVPGGTYVDGVVGGPEELGAVAAKLTKTGLFSIDRDGKLQNQLIESWSVNAEKTQYTFDLLSGVDTGEVVSQLNQNLELFGPALINDEGNGVIALNVTNPNPNIPLLLTQPLFDYGPYKLSKLSDTTAIFTRNTAEFAPKPYINKIVVHLFPTEELLREALGKKKIDGAALESSEAIEGYQTVSYPTPNYYAVILNVNKSPFRNLAYRRSVVAGQSVSRSSVVLTVADEEPAKVIAKQVEKDWEKQGLIVTIELKPTDQITNSIGPTRDFQALLTGISYAPELDPFYLWHSSQIRPPGNNLSGVRDDTIDKLISQIESEYALAERYKKIDELHKSLTKLGVLQIISPVTRQFVVDNNVVVAKPYLPISVRDRWQAVDQWYLK